MGRNKVRRSDDDVVMEEHIRLRTEILDSNAFKAMSLSARAAYPLMRRLLNGFNNGNIAFTYADAKKRGWASSKATNIKIKRELVAVGLIAVTQKGGSSSFSRVPTLYRFTDLKSCEHVNKKRGMRLEAYKRSDDFRKFKKKQQAQDAIKKHIEKETVKAKAANKPKGESR